MNQPAVLGKYVLMERLAAGGMGEVFLARAGARGFERFFALKRILSQHAESPEFVQMLMNEARISVKLVHPNIAQVFEFGQIDQSFFMALEYVEGLSLNAIIRRSREHRRPIRPADAVWVAVQVCRALHYAHNKRDDDGRDLHIIHRDISPHNILVDEGGSVKLIDFGIAKASQGQIQTEASTIKGKIPYMSPEQASGEALDPRSDLYALGIVLYECLTQERMYPSGNTFETFALVRRGKIPDLEEKLKGKVPDALLQLVAKALQREKDKRYQTAAEMESELMRILSALEPGYTSYALADLVAQLDTERAERKARLKAFADISPEELLASAGAPASPAVEEPSSKVLAPPDGPTPPSLPLDITLGSLMKTVSGKGPAAPGPDDPVSELVPPRKSVAPLLAAGLGGAVVVLALVLIVGRGERAAEAPAPPAPDARAPLAAVTPPAPPELTPPAPPDTAAPPVEIAPPPVATPKGDTRRPPAVKKKKDGASETKGKACVAVNAAPWAHVSENGRRLGTTPLPCLELSVGKHTLVLENPVAGQSRSVDVTVKSGETARVFERF